MTTSSEIRASSKTLNKSIAEINGLRSGKRLPKAGGLRGELNLAINRAFEKSCKSFYKLGLARGRQIESGSYNKSTVILRSKKFRAPITVNLENP